jgi:hypothetical protein
MGCRWMWVGGGIPVVSRGAVGRWGRWMWVGGGIPVVSLVPRSTAGYKPSSLRDEVWERGPEDGRSDELEDGIHGGLGLTGSVAARRHAGMLGGDSESSGQVSRLYL